MATPNGLDFRYPAAARNAAWQKTKSFLDKAKSKTKTGLGDTLLKAESAWAKIDFDLMDAKMAGPKPTGKWRSEQQIREGKAAAVTHYNTVVKPAIRALEVAASKARVTAKNTALSKKAQTAATAISGALITNAALMKSYKFDDFDDEEQKLRDGLQRALAVFGNKVLELERKLNDLAKNPTKAEWTRLDVKNGFRSLGNTLGNNPTFADLWPTWRPWDGLQETKMKTTDVEAEKRAITAHIREVTPELRKLKQRIGV